MRRRTELLVSDYAGHGFTVELVRALRERGHDAVYSYCVSVSTPKGSLADATGSIVGVRAGRTFEKYDLRRRLASEVRYGVNLARLVWRRRPVEHVVVNMPLVSLLVTWALSLPLRTRLVLWFQDAQSGLAAGVLGDGTAAKALATLEGFVLRRSGLVVAISEELADEARRHGVAADRIVVIENWAPIESLPVRPRHNEWAVEQGLDDRPVLLYAGTLGRKHRPDLLVALARRVRERDALVVVVSEGEGANWLLREQRASQDLDNLRVMAFQSFERLPDVLATADVLLVLLEPNAGRFSVPSKTLSYLCAGRPIVAAMSSVNTAARTITDRARAGTVVDAHDAAGFAAAAEAFLDDRRASEQAGRRARAFAEEHFPRAVVVDRFAGALWGTLTDS